MSAFVTLLANTLSTLQGLVPAMRVYAQAAPFATTIICEAMEGVMRSRVMGV